jgi:hypothetical protein
VPFVRCELPTSNDSDSAVDETEASGQAMIIGP